MDKIKLFAHHKRIVSVIAAIAMLVSFIPAGIMTARAEEEPKWDGGFTEPGVSGQPSSVSVTKTIIGGDDKPLPPSRRVTVSDSSGSSTTMGSKDENGNYLIASGHFAYVKMNVEEVRNAPNGVDYDLVHGAGCIKVGTGNVKLVGDQIHFTINNFHNTSSSWGLIVSNTSYAGGGNPHAGNTGNNFSHNRNTNSYNGLSLPAGYGEYVYLYFHNNSTLNIRTYNEPDAIEFEFQIVRVEKDNSGNDIKIPVDLSNPLISIIFRSKIMASSVATNPVIGDGGGILGDGKDGKFWLKHNITATFGGLPEGNYQIIEKNYDDYTVTLQPIGEPGSVANFTVLDNGKTVIEFENKIESYELSVTKKVANENEVPLGNKDDGFEIRVTFSGVGTSSLNDVANDKGFTPASNRTVWTGKLKHGEIVKFFNLPVNVTYKVEEINLPPSFDAIGITNGTGTVVKGTKEYFAEVNNEYIETAEIELRALKEVSASIGSAPAAWPTFTFELWASDEFGVTGARLQTKTVNHNSPAAVFDKLSYRTDGTHYYLVKENQSNIASWTLDKKEYLIMVVVEDLEIKASYASRTDSGSDFEDFAFYTEDTSRQIYFSNVYKPGAASLTLLGRKTTSNNSPSSTFNFTVTEKVHPKLGETGAVVGTGRITGAGNFSFSAISFDEIGQYVLEISENTPDAGWTCTTSPKTVYINVTQVGSNLVATAYKNINNTGALVRDDLLFNNTYTAPPISTSLRIRKLFDIDVP
ncbi:MAG: hypothetical protein FWE82_09805, partial [Defluviitaleaceae bacterium]|nr:hypothetical protein [Defluviitaleaceae bacterium]